MNLRDATQEILELGPRRALFRVAWELRGRSGAEPPASHAAPVGQRPALVTSVSFERPEAVAEAVAARTAPAALGRLQAVADAAVEGRILCFSRWTADFGSPIRWHRNPVTGLEWSPTLPWRRALADQAPGDIKNVWEVARFPQAYYFARAAAFFPDRRCEYAAALVSQMQAFVASNDPGFGVHWASGQEIAFRLLSWVFAHDALLKDSAVGTRSAELIAAAFEAGAHHIERHIDYARLAVYNNHLVSEALALFGAGVVLQDGTTPARWRTLGRRILDEEADRQFYPDGGYIQQSHNYHRVALQDYLWACAFARSAGESPSPAWIAAMDRSLAFLAAHQNPADGRLPNYGANDGALPSVLSTCDFGDMRPLLQAVSLVARGERLYDSGPWDEEAAWWAGAASLDAPLRPPTRRSVSFSHSGYHVLRGLDPSNFGAFRCGTLLDRFSQIDMLHLDVWWRGQNVLVDPGSYQYNAAPEWHAHFMRTAAHNSVVVDGRDQMLHHRQFKVLYRTKAELLRFADRPHWAVCEGAHYGFRRHAGRCVHRRSILYLKDDAWIVLDTIEGSGSHAIRLHWLGGDFPWVGAPDENGIDLRTPAGLFTVRMFTVGGEPLPGSAIAGAAEPPRGWLSRYYGEKLPAPSFAAEVVSAAPVSFLSVLAGGQYELTREHGRWIFESPAISASFAVADGTFDGLRVAS